jgi:two-component system sensor histidine kinase GlrK
VVAPDGAPPLVVADSAALVRILRILLDNACAYGAGAVRVAVEPHEETGRVRVLVSDEGPGVAPEESEQVFVRFARGSTAAGRPGFGLGLAIARGLARAMDGDVWAEPGAPGSRFVVELPAWADGD